MQAIATGMFHSEDGIRLEEICASAGDAKLLVCRTQEPLARCTDGSLSCLPCCLQLSGLLAPYGPAGHMPQSSLWHALPKFFRSLSLWGPRLQSCSTAAQCRSMQ